MRNMSPPSIDVVYKYIYIAYENMVVNTVLVNIYLGHIFACTNIHTHKREKSSGKSVCTQKSTAFVAADTKTPESRKACHTPLCTSIRLPTSPLWLTHSFTFSHSTQYIHIYKRLKYLPERSMGNCPLGGGWTGQMLYGTIRARGVVHLEKLSSFVRTPGISGIWVRLLPDVFDSFRRSEAARVVSRPHHHQYWLSILCTYLRTQLLGIRVVVWLLRSFGSDIDDGNHSGTESIALE